MVLNLMDTPSSPRTGLPLSTYGIARLPLYHTLRGRDLVVKACSDLRNRGNPALILILGAIGELFVLKLLLNIPRREVEVYSWLQSPSVVHNLKLKVYQ